MGGGGFHLCSCNKRRALNYKAARPLEITRNGFVFRVIAVFAVLCCCMVQSPDDRGTFLDTIVMFCGQVFDSFGDTLTSDMIVYLVIGLILLFAILRPI